MSNFDCDVVIVGAGMVGLALAAKLAKQNSNLKIAIIDPKPIASNWSERSYDLRVSAITRASELLLREVGAWQRMDEDRISSYQNMFVWDGESTQGEIQFDAKSLGEKNLGHIVENRVLRKALFQSIEHHSNIKFFLEETCQSVEYQDEKATLTLESGTTLSAQLLVAADGAFSWLRENSGIALQQTSYGHKALVATIKTEENHSDTAYQRFDHNGPLAFLPLPEKNVCSIVWSTENNFSDELMDLSPEEFSKKLSQALEYKLGNVELISEKIAFPLFERTAETVISDRLAIIGDAAHTIHPLAGQGVNLGFADVSALAALIIKNKAKQKDLGILSSLRSYQRSRKGDVALMQKTMMGFKALFEQKNPLMQLARATGMHAANNTALIKNTIIKKALGL